MAQHLPSGDVSLNAANLRGVAHPVRLRILSALRMYGATTASALARRLELSSASVSYHMRQLERYGFVVDDPGRGRRRERTWRAAHGGTTFSTGPVVADDGTNMVMLRTAAQVWCADLLAAVEQLPTQPPAWQQASDFSDFGVYLTPAETQSLVAALHAVIRHRRDQSSPGPGTTPCTVQLQVFPTPGGQP
jgi:DNA-binding transcriptional ArsR family regulator